MNIVFAGTPGFAAAAFEAIVTAGFTVVAAYTQPDRPSGRGMRLTPSAVKVAAIQHGVAVMQPASLKSPDAQAALAAFAPEVMVVAAYGLILPQAVLDIPKHGCLNIHASLLPRWRGAAPIHRAILAGDTESGVGIMQMEAGLDTGPVLLERRIAISATETTGGLHDRLASEGAIAIVDVLQQLRSGSPPKAIPQPSDRITYAHKIAPEDAEIDWKQSAAAIDRQVRAFYPAPGAWTTWRGEKLKIWRAIPLTNAAVEEADLRRDSAVKTSFPGTVIDIARERLLIACGSSILAVTEVQKAGGRRMPVSDWLAGTSVNAGDQFGH
jgi:methionyl-tRNA formyltransferase